MTGSPRFDRHRHWSLLVVVAGLLLARAAAADNVPVVFVPGLLGSELVDQDGNKVWGPLIKSLRHFEDLEFPLDPAADQIRAVGLVESLQILGPFAIEQYSGLLGTLEDLGFEEGKDLFLFPYDWRQSNFVSAEELRAFVRSKPALRGKYRIVTHSMGGLVARVFLDRFPEGRRVDRLVTLGTPHLGSHSALRPLLEGMGTVQDLLAGGTGTVRRVAFSMPSLYEMLPFYVGCCVDDSLPPQRVDLLTEQVWNRFTWLPDEQRTPQRTEWRRKALARARELRDVVRRGLPAGVTLYPVAGAILSTQEQAIVKDSGKRLEWGRQGSGDGTVIDGSAAAADFPSARVAIRRHSTIFQDDHVKVQLARLLIDDDQIRNFASTSMTAEATTRAGSKVKISRVDLVLDPPFARPGAEVTATLEVFDEAGAKVSDLGVLANLTAEGTGLQQPILLQAATDGSLRGTATLTAAGAYRLSVTIPGVDGVFEEYVVVDAE